MSYVTVLHNKFVGVSVTQWLTQSNSYFPCYVIIDIDTSRFFNYDTTEVLVAKAEEVGS